MRIDQTIIGIAASNGHLIITLCRSLRRAINPFIFFGKVQPRGGVAQCPQPGRLRLPVAQQPLVLADEFRANFFNKMVGALVFLAEWKNVEIYSAYDMFVGEFLHVSWVKFIHPSSSYVGSGLTFFSIIPANRIT